MFIVAKRNLILPSKDGKQKHRVRRDFVGEIPDWAADTRYFAALVADGKIGISNSKKDAAIAEELKKPVAGQHGKPKPKPKKDEEDPKQEDPEE